MRCRKSRPFTGKREMVKDVRGFTKCQIGRRIGLYSVLPTYTYRIIWIVSRFLTFLYFVKEIWRKNMLLLLQYSHFRNRHVPSDWWVSSNPFVLIPLHYLSASCKSVKIVKLLICKVPPNLQYEKFFNIYWTQKPGSCRPI